MSLTADRAPREAAADPRWKTSRLMTASLAIAILTTGLISLWWGTGSVRMSPTRVWTALTDEDAVFRIEAVAAEARLVRVVMGILVGASLASAGAMLQSLYRNPLASPQITGVTQGSVVAVVMWLLYGPNSESTWVLPLVGALGGVGTGLLTYGISKLGGRVDPLRLILVGVLLGGLLSSMTALVLISADGAGLDLISWTVGSLQSASWSRIRLLAIALLLCIPLILLAIPYGNALNLGEEIAHGAGVSVNRGRGIVLLAAASITAASVSLVGGIGFIGLVAPHIVRRWTGADLRRLVPNSALSGALLVLLADFASRNLRPRDVASALGVAEEVAPTALPTGIFLALIGAPFFIHLLRRTP
ncbi:MAG: iron ABC transporter permease [Actinomycetota bacterium]